MTPPEPYLVRSGSLVQIKLHICFSTRRGPDGLRPKTHQGEPDQADKGTS